MPLRPLLARLRRQRPPQKTNRYKSLWRSEIQKILVIKLKHIGDVLLLTPVLEMLHANDPQCETTVLVPKGTEEMVQGHPLVKDVMVFDRDVKRFQWTSMLRAQWGLVRALRRRAFDIAIDLSGGDRGAILAFCSGAPIRLGYRRRKGMFGRDWLFTRVVDADFTKSVVASHADVVGLLGFAPTVWAGPKLYPSAKARARIQGLLASLGVGPQERLVVFHPTSRWMFKSLGADACAQIAQHLVQKWECRVAFTCGPQEKERVRIRQIMAVVRENVLDLSGKTSLEELAALLERAQAFIGVDSAPMHIAYAVGIPTWSFFGPSDPVQWAPRGDRHKIMSKRWACQPCQRDGCLGSKISQCLTDWTQAELIAGLDSWMRHAVNGAQA